MAPHPTALRRSRSLLVALLGVVAASVRIALFVGRM